MAENPACSSADVVCAAVAKTLWTAADWLDGRGARELLRFVAGAVAAADFAAWTTCPVCQETECDEDCPLAEVRAAAKR